MLISQAGVAWVFEGMLEEVPETREKNRKMGKPNRNRGSGSGAAVRKALREKSQACLNA